VRVTRQTGVAQVPSTSPDESEVVYLSDSGGHGNLWVASTDGAGARQITFERDSGVSIGVPMWSPTSNQIAFIVTRGGIARQWLVNSDGSDPRDFVGGVMASWSPDGKWLYYALRRRGMFEIEKIAAGGGSSVPVRADDAATPAVGADGTLYWTTPIKGGGGVWEWVIRKARPESGEAVTLVRVNGARVPWEFRAVQPILSPDQKWLAQPLVDGVTTNLWLIDTLDGSLRRVTDYGDLPIMIASTRVVVPRRQQDLCGGRRNRCGHRPIPESGAGLSAGLASLTIERVLMSACVHAVRRANWIGSYAVCQRPSMQRSQLISGFELAQVWSTNLHFRSRFPASS
jgi:Tol biopolymer transport system component